MRRAVLIFLLSTLTICALAAPKRERKTPEQLGLHWDEPTREVQVEPGETTVLVEFAVENRGEKAFLVTEIEPSCGCTTYEAPPLPWRIAPGEKSSLRLRIDLAGKKGDLVKMVYVITSAGRCDLRVNLHIPPAPEGSVAAARREANQRRAVANRQAVLVDPSCVRCHANSVASLRGETLFAATCAVCHLAANRAEMVPDLAKAGRQQGADYWDRWIREGKEGTLMPAFAREHGGPLDAAQIKSLTDYLATRFR